MISTIKGKLTAAVVLAVVGVLGIGTGVLALQGPRRQTGLDRDKTLVADEPKGKQAAVDLDSPHDPDFVGLVEGKLVRSSEVTKDCMVLAYLPDWGFGNVDNIGFEGHDGGVRTLVDWPNVPMAEVDSPSLRFYLAFYARKANDKPKAGSIVALEIASDWPERTSWNTRPYAEAEPVGTYKYQPGDGWKVFEITSFVRARAGQSGHGLMFRYINEDRPGTLDWTGYQIVSREGADRTKRPRLLVVDGSKK